MRIVKEGKIPEEDEFAGKCSKCGCEIECTRKELTYSQDVRDPDPYVNCPTKGCGALIYPSPLPATPADDNRR